MARGGKRQGAGAKKGAKHNSKKKVLDELITDAIAKKCIENLVKLANGVKVQKRNNKGEVEIFDKPPDYFANSYLLDQKYGKATQKAKIEGELEHKGELKINLEITKYEDEQEF